MNFRTFSMQVSIINKNIKPTMLDKIKKNWKTILIIVLILFSLNKCTQSCNRQSKIDKQNVKIEQLDSTLQEKNSEIVSLKRDTSDYLNRIRMYDKFGKQTDEYIKQRNRTDSLNAANSAKQKAQTDELIRQNRELLNRKNK